jgi:ankyrin repeat protein
MKFGKTLIIHQIPEWSTNYINYKHLKKIIKTIDAGDGHGIEDLDTLALTLSQFFFELDRNIEIVDDFYNTKFIEYNRRLDKIVSVLGYNDDTKTIGHHVDSHDELDEVISILLELRTIFRNLKWYAELNHRGFVKILKKLDKKLTALTTHLDTPLPGFSNDNKDVYLLTRVNALPFANGLDLVSSLNTISTIITQLGDIDDFPDKLTVENFNSLKIARKYSDDQETLDQLTSLINENNSDELEKQLTVKSQSLKFLNSLLNKAALINATSCIDVLLKVMFDQFENPLYDKSDISGRNFFHQHLIGLGKKQLNINSDFIPGETTDLNRFFSRSKSPEAINEKISIGGLIYIIDHIGEKYKHLLVEKDNYFRTPLHYAAQYGLATVVQVWLDQLKEAQLLPENISIDNLEYWGDQESLTPLHLAIIGRHPKTVKTLVASLPFPLSTPQLLLIAVRMGSPEILDCLIGKGGINIDYTDLENRHETALYIAARLNFYETVEFLLTHDANVEIGESVFGWTPIFIAANEGFKSIVKLLLEFGAKYDQVDDSGWLPMEHACLRGHLTLADLLKPQDPSILMYDMYHPENNSPRVPPARSELVLSNKEFIKSTSSIEVLPEHSRNAVDKVYKQLKKK